MPTVVLHPLFLNQAPLRSPQAPPPTPSEPARGCGMTRMQGSQTGPRRAWHKGRGVSSRSLSPIPQAGTVVSCAQQPPQSLPSPHSFLSHPMSSVICVSQRRNTGQRKGRGQEDKGREGRRFLRKPSGGPCSGKLPGSCVGQRRPES